MLASMSRPHSHARAGRTADLLSTTHRDALAEMEGEDEALANAVGDAQSGESSAGQPPSEPQVLDTNTMEGDPPPAAEPSPMTIEAAMGADSPMTEVE